MEIAQLRLSNQQISGTSFTTARQMVSWMGAMQAQDFSMAKWALGVRLPGSTQPEIEHAFNRGEIIRTHVLRPTWHLVAAEDLRWMLALSAAHIKAAVKSYNTGLGLTEALAAKSNALLAQLLKNGRHLTRAELTLEFHKNGLPSAGNQPAQLLMLAELDGLICSGPTRGHHATYALLEEWVPAAPMLDRPAALAALAGRYFASHGPASLADFAWWAGLSAGEARQGLEAVRSGLISETLAEQTYWLKNPVSAPQTGGPALHLLPGFDEFIISYQDRSAALTPAARARVITSNGIFRPVILRAGEVLGVWNKTSKKEALVLQAALFETPDPHSRSEIEQAGARYGRFVNKPVEFRNCSWVACF